MNASSSKPGTDSSIFNLGNYNKEFKRQSISSAYDSRILCPNMLVNAATPIKT